MEDLKHPHKRWSTTREGNYVIKVEHAVARSIVVHRVDHVKVFKDTLDNSKHHTVIYITNEKGESCCIDLYGDKKLEF